MSTIACIVRRSAPVLVLTSIIAASCAVPTDPRWERAADADIIAESIESSAQRYIVEAAPVVASTEFRSRIVPAVETTLVAPAAGRTVSRLVATGDPVSAGEPILEWSTGAAESTQLRIDILELELQLAELEGRTDDAAAVQAEMVELRAAADRENTAFIVSPIDGVVGRYLTDRSTEFEPDDPLVTVGDPARTRIELVLGADAVGALSIGTALQVVDAQNRFAEPIPAVITDISAPTRAALGGEQTISAVLDQVSELAVGTRVIVNIDRQSDEAGRRLVAEAVLDDGLGPFVIVEDASGWHRRDIELGLVTDSFVELLTDIAVGTTVVVP